MSKAIKQFKSLSPQQRAWVIAAIVVEFATVVLAQRDIHRRPAEQIRGNKWLWRGFCAINWASGPEIYYLAGRRRGTSAPDSS